MAENNNLEVQEDADEARIYWANYFFRYYNVEGHTYLSISEELVCSDYLEVE